MIQEELNVHDVVFEKDLDEFMDYTLKPDFKKPDRFLGAKVKELAAVLGKGTAILDEKLTARGDAQGRNRRRDG